MNEHEEPKLRSRRERRMQEQLETTGIPVISDATAPETEFPADAADVTAGAGDRIEISPVDEQGRSRTRREMRELREAALAQRGDAQDAADETLADVPADVPESREDDAADVAGEADAEPGTEDTLDTDAAFDPRLAQTEAMSFADILDIDSIAERTDSDISIVDMGVDSDDDDASADVDAEQDGEDVPSKSRFRLPWSRSKESTADAESVEVEPVVAEPTEAEPTEAETFEAGSEVADSVDSEPIVAEAIIVDLVVADDESTPKDAAEESIDVAPVVVEVVAEQEPIVAVVVDDVDDSASDADVDEAPHEAAADVPKAEPQEPTSPAFVEDDEDEDEDGEVEFAPTPTSARTSYSFPDIAPLAEERSVFDDPSTQAIDSLPSDDLIAPRTERTGDFDDLISRAIAAEGATSTNTAALILPSMPEGTDLAGPLGETGELFVTGSIELPKSLGETGGHARLHDSIEFDPLADLGVDLTSEPVLGDSAPVSATRAISARNVEGSGVVAPHTKKGNRLPLILSLTAGGLLLAVIGLLAWGASNGMFG